MAILGTFNSTPNSFATYASIITIGERKPYTFGTVNQAGGLKTGYTPVVLDVLIKDSDDDIFDKFDTTAVGTQLIAGIILEYDATLGVATVMLTGHAVLSDLGMDNKDTAARLIIAENALRAVGITTV